MTQTFDQFMAARAEAASAYVAGNAAPVVALSAEQGQATFFDPGGGFTEGAEAVNASNRKGADNFGPGGTSQFEIMDQGSDGELAFWTGFQVAEITMRKDGSHVPMRLRVTEVFRRVDGEWRMVHRHASMAKD